MAHMAGTTSDPGSFGFEILGCGGLGPLNEFPETVERSSTGGKGIRFDDLLSGE